MKRLSLKTGVFVLVFTVISALISFADTTDYGAKGAEGKASFTLEQMLTYALQDEYLARAEYRLIIEEYSRIRPFTNIMAAEERHIEWVTELFREYGFRLPADTADDHVVVPGDLKAALETGVQAEIDNIAMYKTFLNQKLPEDVREVFEMLQRGSENHLRAFRNNLQRYR